MGRLSGGRSGRSTLISKTKVYSDSDKSQFGISNTLNPSLNEVWNSCSAISILSSKLFRSIYGEIENINEHEHELQTEFPPIDFAFAWRQNKPVKKQNIMFY